MGLSIVPVWTEPTHLFGIMQVSSCPPVALVATGVIVGSSLSSPRGIEPLPMKAHLGAFLPVPSQYVLVLVLVLFMRLLFFLFLSLNSKDDF
jgi:hypothetical protein